MAETARNQLTRPGEGSTPKTAEDLRRDIAEIRDRISASIESAEGRTSARMGVKSFDAIPTGWRGVASTASTLIRGSRRRGSKGRRAPAVEVKQREAGCQAQLRDRGGLSSSLKCLDEAARHSICLQPFTMNRLNGKRLRSSRK